MVGAVEFFFSVFSQTHRRAGRRLVSALASLALLGALIVATALPARAQSNLALATIVAPNATNSTTTDLSTIVLTGTDLPIAPDADMGKEEDTDFVEVNDTTNGWIAGFGTGGFFHASCYVTIGASTSTELILSVGNQGALCLNDFVHAGDNITVSLIDAGGNTLASVSSTAVANPTAGSGSVTVPVVSGVTPTTGPAAGGTSAAPGSGSVTVNTGSATTPEAFWFGGYTITAGWYGVATTDFTPTATPGVFNVVPPAYVFGSRAPQNFGVSVFSADSTFGMSDQNCTVEITGCSDEYFYTNNYSGSTSLSFDPPLNWSQAIATSSAAGSSSCGVGSSSGVSKGLSVGGSLAGGPLTFNGGVDVSDSNSGIPEAFIANASLVVASPLAITVTLTGGISSCEQIPIPDLSIPNVGGLYFQIGGSISANISLTITINQGTYSLTGGWIPGGSPFANFTTNCVDADGNPTTSCISTQLSASLVGAVSISPLWLQVGPSVANVGAGLTAAAVAQGTINVPPWPPTFTLDGDICVAGNWNAQINIGNFNASTGGDWLGPFNIFGDGTICPLGSIAGPGLPGAPTSPAATGGDSSATVTWSPPDSDGGSPITGYNVYEGTTAGGESTTPVNSSPLSATAASDLITSLTNGTSYFFTVTAINAVGEGPASAEVTATPTAAGPTLPGAPTSPAATPGDGSAGLTWAPPASDGGSPITGYNVYEGTATGAEATTPVNPTPLPADATSFDVPALTNGTAYFFTITAINAVGEGPASTEVTATPTAAGGPTVPGAPTSPAATPGDGAATVTWSPPTIDGGSPVTGYNVYQGTTAGGESTTPVNAAPLSASAATDLITGLTNGTTYFFTVTAVNAVGEGPASTEVSTTPTAASGPTVPGAPTSPAATPGDGAATVTWSPPTTDGGSAVTGYNVYSGTTAGGESATPLNPAPLSATAASYLISSLTNGTEYFFTVTAVNAVGEGPPSAEVTATPKASAGPTVPAPPVSLRAVSGDASATVTWTPPASDGGSPITGYNVYAGTTAGGESTTPVNAKPLPPGTTSDLVSGLTNGTAYFFTITAVNAVGESGPSAEVSTTPAAVSGATAPSAPLHLKAKPGNHKVTLTWEPPASDGGSTVTGYDVYELCGYGPEKLANPLPLSAEPTSYTVTGLANGVSCRFTVKAINAVGISPASKSATATPHAPIVKTPPSPPRHLKAKGGNHKVTLTWTPPAFTGGSPITGYKVIERCGYGPAKVADRHPLPPSATSYRVTGLVNGVSCRFTVKAINAIGTSAPSAPARATPHAPVLRTPPGAPRELTAAAGNHEVTLSWSPPASDGGSPITGYNVYVTCAPGSSWGAPVNLHPLPATARGAVVTGLTNGRKYRFTVKAINAVGAGAAAVPVGATPHRVPPPPPPSKPVDPAIVPTIVLSDQRNAAVLALH